MARSKRMVLEREKKDIPKPNGKDELVLEREVEGGGVKLYLRRRRVLAFCVAISVPNWDAVFDCCLFAALREMRCRSVAVM